MGGPHLDARVVAVEPAGWNPWDVKSEPRNIQKHRDTKANKEGGEAGAAQGRASHPEEEQ